MPIFPTRAAALGYLHATNQPFREPIPVRTIYGETVYEVPKA